MFNYYMSMDIIDENYRSWLISHAIDIILLYVRGYNRPIET